MTEARTDKPLAYITLSYQEVTGCWHWTVQRIDVDLGGWSGLARSRRRAERQARRAGRRVAKRAAYAAEHPPVRLVITAEEAP